MNRKTTRKPLKLTKETIRSLVEKELVTVAAGREGPFVPAPATCDSAVSCCT
jgi:hypothetical protein